MRKLFLVATAAVCLLASHAFASTGTDGGQRLIVEPNAVDTRLSRTGNSLLLLAEDDKEDGGRDRNRDRDRDRDRDCDNIVSPSKHCKEHHGHGDDGEHGRRGEDGSPNGLRNRKS